ncbi:MAG TPA: glycosyltransferase [Blastocatellia bacterium]|nr:glycosyltransferase [Blastocatellia bacterium]
MKIIHVITSLQAHGAQMMLYRVLSRMDRTRFENAVVSLTDGGSLKEKFEALNLPLFSAGMKAGMPTPAAVYRLVRAVRRYEPELVQGWMYHGNLAAQLAARLSANRPPVVWNIRTSNCDLKEEKPFTAAIIKLGGKLSQWPKAIVNNSTAGALNHEERLGYCALSRVVIPNGFDTDLFAPSDEARIALRSQLGLSEDAFLIGLVGRFHPVKDHACFLRAAAMVSNKYPHTHFVLAGEGVYEGNRELREMIEGFALSGRAHLLGERRDVHRVHAALDVAVSSSAFGEGFPNVIGEAMSCGVPTVATDVGDSSLVVADAGRVVPPRNAGALANALLELVGMAGEQRRELGSKARRRIIENYSIDTIVSRYESLYQQVISTCNIKEGDLNVRYRWFG